VKSANQVEIDEWTPIYSGSVKENQVEIRF